MITKHIVDFITKNAESINREFVKTNRKRNIISDLENLAEEHKCAEIAYLLSKEIKCTDIARMQNVVVSSGDKYFMAKFAQDVPNADQKKLKAATEAIKVEF